MAKSLSNQQNVIEMRLEQPVFVGEVLSGGTTPSNRGRDYSVKRYWTVEGLLTKIFGRIGDVWLRCLKVARRCIMKRMVIKTN